jgi:hypothetical protein
MLRGGGTENRRRRIARPDIERLNRAKPQRVPVRQRADLRQAFAICPDPQLDRCFLMTSDDLRRLLANLRSAIIGPCLPGWCRDETGRTCVSCPS